MCTALLVDKRDNYVYLNVKYDWEKGHLIVTIKEYNGNNWTWAKEK